MNLQTILYGQFTPPLVATTRKHRIMQDGKPYVPFTPNYSRIGPKPNQQKETIEKLEVLVRENPGIDIKELSVMTGRAKSYVYRMLLEMKSCGTVRSVRGKSSRHDGPKTTLFYIKD